MSLLIKNAKVVSSDNIVNADIYIENGKIAQIGEQIKRPAFKIIDANGKLVMPGGIDVNVNIKRKFADIESVDNFKTASIAAAFGGNTSFLDCIIPDKGESITKAFENKLNIASSSSLLDFGFHIGLTPPLKHLKELKALSQNGLTSTKLFLADKKGLMLDDNNFVKALKESNKHGMLACVHAENGTQIDVLTNLYTKTKQTGLEFFPVSRPSKMEYESVVKVLIVSGALKTPVYFTNLSTKSAVEEVVKAQKNAKAKYFIETCPHYLLLDESNYDEEFESAKYFTCPPLRNKTELEYLKNNLIKNIDVIVSNHCAYNMSTEKKLGINNFTKVPPGIPGIETRLPLMFNEMVINQALPLCEFVRLNCTNPAEIFGIKNKGDIKEGYDADICIWDPDLKWEIKQEELHQDVDYTPYEGMQIKGKPETVILRGNLIIENQQLKSVSGFGNFIKREKFSDS